MEKTMARALKTKKTYKAVIYIRGFFSELNLFAVAGKTSPAFPQYSNKGRAGPTPLQSQNVRPKLRKSLLSRPDIELHGGQFVYERDGGTVLT